MTTAARAHDQRRQRHIYLQRQIPAAPPAGSRLRAVQPGGGTVLTADCGCWSRKQIGDKENKVNAEPECLNQKRDRTTMLRRSADFALLDMRLALHLFGMGSMLY